MKANTASSKNGGFDYAFIASVFILLGSALLESWLWQVRAGLRAHLILALPGLYLAGLSAYNYRWWQQNVGQNYKGPDRGTHGATRSDMGWALLLLGAGSILGLVILAGSVFLLSLVATFMLFIPWSRMSFCRRRMAMSCLIGCMGAGTILAFGHHTIAPMFLPLSVLALWSCACAAVLLQIHQKQKGKQNTTAGTGDSTASQQSVAFHKMDDIAS